MSDKDKKAAEVNGLMDELFDTKSKEINGLKGVHKIPKPLISNKKEKTKVVHENAPLSGGTVVHGENAQVIHNHNISDYKVDNSAIDQGRAVIAIRQRGERVNPVNMTPKEYENYLYFQFKIPGKRGWNGVERSDFAKTWEPDYSQNITTKEDALDYLGIKETKKSPDGVEKRVRTSRRSGQKDLRKNKIDRRTLKQRRKDDLTNNLTYFITMGILLVSLISWVSYSVMLHIEGLTK